MTRTAHSGPSKPPAVHMHPTSLLDEAEQRAHQLTVMLPGRPVQPRSIRHSALDSQLVSP